MGGGGRQHTACLCLSCPSTPIRVAAWARSGCAGEGQAAVCMLPSSHAKRILPGCVAGTIASTCGCMPGPWRRPVRCRCSAPRNPHYASLAFPLYHRQPACFAARVRWCIHSATVRWLNCVRYMARTKGCTRMRAEPPFVRPQPPGCPLRNTYSALNALAGHYNSFGTSAPIPKKRLDRLVKVRARVCVGAGRVRAWVRA